MIPMCEVLATKWGAFVLTFTFSVPDPLAIMTMSCPSERDGIDDSGSDKSPQTEWFSVLTFFPSVAFFFF